MDRHLTADVLFEEAFPLRNNDVMSQKDAAVGVPYLFVVGDMPI